jgi:hypothetical protein
VTSIVIAVIALVGAVFSSAVAVGGNLVAQRRLERRATDRAARRYYEPLAVAAYDLQSRIFNILRQDFLVFVREDRWGRSETALASTSFAFAQYFGWREILRREVELLEFETQDISHLLSRITTKFASDDLGARFLLWKSEQRAIGEAMIGSWRDEPSCIGYLEFLKRRSTDLRNLLEPIERDLAEVAVTGADERLRAVQHLLVDLIQMLDPKSLRYQPEKLGRA